MTRTINFILLTSLFYFACDSRPANSEEALARVGDYYLFPSDLGSIESTEDSTTWSKEQIEVWVKRQLWFKEAEEAQIGPDIEKLVLDYKQSLLIAAYQEKLVEEEGVAISEESILDFFKENQNKYTLDRELYKLRFYLLDEQLDEDEILKKLNNQEQDENLAQYCANFPEKCLRDAVWVENTVLEGIELPMYLWNTSVKFLRFYREDGSTGLFRIESKKKEGDPAPLELVQSEIIEILRFQKEKEIIQKHEEKLMLNAQNENGFAIY